MSDIEPAASTEEKRATSAPVFRDVLSNAIRYWERRRILYNAVLVAIVLLWFILAWPGSKQALQLEPLLTLFVLAVLANVAYCAAYVLDIALQYSSMREGWFEWRFLLLTLGILLASALAYLFVESLVHPW